MVQFACPYVRGNTNRDLTSHGIPWDIAKNVLKPTIIFFKFKGHFVNSDFIIFELLFFVKLFSN